MLKRTINVVLIIIGHVSVALGVAGIFLPVLPTTPFLLLAAICYAKGSEKLYNWLIEHAHLGLYIKDFREGKGIPLKAKILAMIMLWGSMSITVIFFIPLMYVKIALLVIAVGVSVYILKQKTKEKES